MTTKIAWTWMLTIAACLATLLPAGRAEAWHGYDEWQHSGDGSVRSWPGSDGLRYLGSPRDFTMTCADCHIGGPGRTRATVSFTPSLSGGRYSPGQRYSVHVQMTTESKGTSGCSRRNTNSIVAWFSDPGGRTTTGQVYNDSGGRACGTLGSGGTGGTTIVRGNCEYVSGQGDGTGPIGGKNWHFQWQAPSSGDAKLWLGLVDGDCFQRVPMSAQTYDDDDVFMLEMDIPRASASLLIPGTPEVRYAHGTEPRPIPFLRHGWVRPRERGLLG